MTGIPPMAQVKHKGVIERQEIEKARPSLAKKKKDLKKRNEIKRKSRRRRQSGQRGGNNEISERDKNEWP